VEGRGIRKARKLYAFMRVARRKKGNYRYITRSGDGVQKRESMPPAAQMDGSSCAAWYRHWCPQSERYSRVSKPLFAPTSMITRPSGDGRSRWYAVRSASVFPLVGLSIIHWARQRSPWGSRGEETIVKGSNGQGQSLTHSAENSFV
jgi:hypothetical protein